jgi:Protein of unknown function (DUF664)
MERIHKPDRRLADPAQLLLGFLDNYRTVVVAKLDGLSDTELRTSRLPSGWVPLALLKHLLFMERRWLRWGFLAEPVPDPFGDSDDSDRWQVGPDDTLVGLAAALAETGRDTRAIVEAARLEDVGQPGGRFPADDPRPRPTLAWILVHVLQEYARHAGHLDVTRELIDGATGE